MRKVLVSFLGRNRYIPCTYFFNNSSSDRVKDVFFIQEAVVKRCCTAWSPDDRIFIFLTRGAETLNWEGENRLRQRLVQAGSSASVIPVREIPEGFSEDEMWEIFHRVVSVIEDRDEIWFDITHGFRSLPMLGMVLINYLKSIRNISIGDILYGAFEALGTIPEVEKMPVEKREAPVISLKAFDNLQEWSLGADVFVRYGISALVEKAIANWIDPLLKSTRGHHELAGQLRGLQKSLHEVPGLLQTVRGVEIIAGDKIRKLCFQIETLKNTGKEYRALGPLLDKILEKLAPFNEKESDINNGFVAVRWCIDHGMVQQGITLLQENMVSWLANQGGLDYSVKDDRELAAQAFTIVARDLPDDKWKSLSRERKTESLVLQVIVRKYTDLAVMYVKLGSRRNDINHGGYLPGALSADKFEETLKETLKSVQRVIGIVV